MDYKAKSSIHIRAQTAFAKAGIFRDIIDIAMDLAAADADCPLDWEKLHGFDDFNFAHDIFGIYKHLNRTTLKIEHCFLPRCALPEIRCDCCGEIADVEPVQIRDGVDMLCTGCIANEIGENCHR